MNKGAKMEKTKNLPWSFTVVFDEKKAKDNGHTTGELYDYVDEVVAQYDVERIGHSEWHTKSGQDESIAQYLALSRLSKDPAVMKTLSSLTFFEEDGDEPIDFIDIVKSVTPERVYEQ